MSEKNKMIKNFRHLLDRMKGKGAAGPRCPSLFCNARGVDSIAEERKKITKGNEHKRSYVVLIVASVVISTGLERTETAD